MKHWLSRILVPSLLCIMSVSAEEAPTPETLAKSKIENMLQLEVSSVADAPVDGLLQVMTSRGLFYVSKDGQFLLHGRIYNMNEQMRNETEETLSAARIEGLKDFTDDMITFKAENERYAITVFTDITCGYCRKLHNEIANYNQRGITVNYLAYPRDGLSSDSYNDMVSIWCAEDQQQAMTDAKALKRVSPKTCKTNIDEQYLFGQKVGINATPALVLEDGTLIPGYQPASQLEKVLAMR